MKSVSRPFQIPWWPRCSSKWVLQTLIIYLMGQTTCFNFYFSPLAFTDRIISQSHKNDATMRLEWVSDRSWGGTVGICIFCWLCKTRSDRFLHQSKWYIPNSFARICCSGIIRNYFIIWLGGTPNHVHCPGTAARHDAHLSYTQREPTVTLLQSIHQVMPLFRTHTVLARKIHAGQGQVPKSWEEWTRFGRLPNIRRARLHLSTDSVRSCCINGSECFADEKWQKALISISKESRMQYRVRIKQKRRSNTCKRIWSENGSQVTLKN